MMLKIETYEALLALTDLRTTLSVAAINAINSAALPNDAERRGEASFRRRVEQIYTSSVPDMLPAEQAMSILLACNDCEVGQLLHGLGGCVATPLDEALQDIVQPETSTADASPSPSP